MSDTGQCAVNVNNPNTTVCRPLYEWKELHARIADLEATEKIANNVRAELFCNIAVLRISLGRAHEYVRSLRALNAVTGPTVDIEIKRMGDVLSQTR